MASGGLESKACRTCAAAKRKCDKQVPACTRCQKRGVDCRYPASKPTSFVLCDDEEDAEDVVSSRPCQPPLSFSTPLPSAACSLDLQALQSGSRFDAFIPGLEFALPDLGLESLLNISQASAWFASMDTWEVRSPTPDQILPVNMIDLKAHTATIFGWFSQWLEEGNCPFIHSELYRSRFPKFLQEVYAILSSYIHRTPSNERIVFRIVEENALTLVREQSSIYQSSAQPSLDEKVHPSLDALEHLARVHALLIHQMIGLYDGDIRLRHVAEQHIPVLQSWMQQMLLYTQQTFFLGASLVVPSHMPEAVIGHALAGTLLPQNALWHTWILAESIRRTWIVASGLEVAYLTVKEGCIGTCRGGMMFTTRKGVWEAKSAAEWEKICSEVNVGLVQMADVSKIMARVPPDEVNDFAKTVIGITSGKESMRVWLASKQALEAP
ncbi:hypothetical protein V8E51_014101 [Hyaloscypha variabilis]